MEKEENQKVFKSKEVEIDGIKRLGQLIATEDPGIQALIQWAMNKERQCYDSVHKLVTNPDVSANTVFYNLGEARAVQTDLTRFLKAAEMNYITGKKKEK